MNFYDEGALEITSSESGLLIAVSQEQAMDSYNQTFTCQVLLSPSEAERLRDFLNEMLS